MDPVDGLLPAWATWTPIGAYALGSVVACLAAAGIAAWVTMRPFARAGDTHWTERARHAYGGLFTFSLDAISPPPNAPSPDLMGIAWSGVFETAPALGRITIAPDGYLYHLTAGWPTAAEIVRWALPDTL